MRKDAALRMHNEVARCTHLGLCKKKAFERVRNHPVQEVVIGDNADILVNTTVHTPNEKQGSPPGQT